MNRRRASDARLIGSVSELRENDHISYTDPESGERITGIIASVHYLLDLWDGIGVIMTIRCTSGKSLLVNMATGEPIVLTDKILTDNNLNNGTIVYRKDAK